MSAINDKSIQEAISLRQVELAYSGCLQGRRLLYGISPCFDDIILAKLELDYLDGIDTPVVTPPVDPISPASYTPPQCGFAFDLVDGDLPEGLRNGTLLLVPGYTYTADVIASFTQNDAGALTEVQYLRNNVELAGGPYQQIDQITFTRSTPGLLVFGTRIYHEEGPVKNDGAGNPDPSGQIQAGFVQCGSKRVLFELPVFWGTIDTPGNLFDLINLTDVSWKFVDQSNPLTVQYDNIDNPGYFWLAVPDTFPVYTNWFESINNQGTINQPDDFMEIASLTVPMDIGNGNIQNYTVYISAYPTEGSSDYIFSAE